VSYQVSHPYKTTGKNTYNAVQLNHYIFGKQIGRQQILHQMLASIP